MDFEKLVNDEVKKLFSSGKIELMIEKKLEETVKSIVTNCLEGYSDFGKALKEKVVEGLDLKNLKIDLPSYGKTMCNIAQDLVEKTMLAETKEKIEENMKKIFNPLEKKEWKLSEIVKKFIEDIRIDGDEGEVTLIVEEKEDGAFKRIYLDEDEHKDKYECAYEIALHKGRVFHSKIKDVYVKNMKVVPFFDFDLFLFQLNACEAIIEIDENNCETSWGENND